MGLPEAGCEVTGYCIVLYMHQYPLGELRCSVIS
jgi:hypothetical protein